MTDYNWNDAPDWATCVIRSKLDDTLHFWCQGWRIGATIKLVKNASFSTLDKDFYHYFTLVESMPAPFSLSDWAGKSPEIQAKADEETEARKSPEYASLARVLEAAFQQSATGKGKERHGNGKSFEQQPILSITRIFGLGYPMGQVSKKLEEAKSMVERGEYDAAMQECLGAIVYAAACHVYTEEQKNEQ